MKRNITALCLAFCLLAAMLPAGMALTPKDIGSHWAREDMLTLNSLDIMRGYPDGTFGPDKNITKAEYIVLLNRTFGLGAASYGSFPDVSPTAWYRADIQKAAAADYLFTFNGQVRPDQALTREEAAAMFGRLLGLPQSTARTSFSDDAGISSWAKPYIAAVAEARIIAGYPDGSFHPTEPITRAEVCRVLTNVMGQILTTGQNISFIDKTNVTVMFPGVTLNSVHIKGDLLLTGGVGSGTVTLRDCRVDGSIKAIGSPGVTLVLAGDTAGTIRVRGDGLSLSVTGKVEELVFGNTSGSAAGQIAADAAVKKLTLTSAAAITGTGKVEELKVERAGVSLSMQPEAWTLPLGVSAQLAGQTVTASGTKGPSFAQGYPKATVKAGSTGGQQTVELRLKTQEPSQVYAVAVNRGSPAPTAAQVKAMASYGYTAVLAHNFTVLTQTDLEMTLTLTGLPAGVDFDVYVVTESLEQTPTLSSPQKLQPGSALFYDGYPRVGAVTANSATLEAKVMRAATLYWTALPHGSAAPTAAQIVAQNGLQGYGQASLAAGVLQQFTVAGMSGTVTEYDLYVTAVESGSATPLNPLKFELGNVGNTAKVQYSAAAQNDAYPVYTAVTLQFNAAMYKAGTSTPLGAAGADPSSVMGISAVRVADNLPQNITGYTISMVGENTVMVVPPTGGWTTGLRYTISLAGLRDGAGNTPVPASITFAVGQSASAIAAPVFSAASGTSLLPGNYVGISAGTPNSVIQYTTDGTDPINGNFTTIPASGAYLQIPASVAYGVLIKAVARRDLSYSDTVTAQYTIGHDPTPPIVTLAATGETLQETARLVPGTVLRITTMADTDEIYYTTDGKVPDSSSQRYNNLAGLTLTGTVGSVIHLKVISVRGGISSQTRGFTVTLGETNAASALPAAPSVIITGYLAPCDNGVGYEIYAGQSINIHSFNQVGRVMVFYTLDGTDPRESSGSRQVWVPSQVSEVRQIAASTLTPGAYTKLRLVAYDNQNGNFSAERLILFVRK